MQAVKGGAVKGDASLFITTNRAVFGSTFKAVTKTITSDGKTRWESIDRDGNGVAESIESDAVTTTAAGVRTEANHIANNNNTLRSGEVTVISANGKEKTINSDVDGDGQIDVRQITLISGAAWTATTSTVTTRNGDNSLRGVVTVQQSADTLTKTTFVDAVNDNDQKFYFERIAWQTLQV